MGDNHLVAPTQLIRLRGSRYGNSEVALRAEGVRRIDDELQLTNCVRVLIADGIISAVGRRCRSYVLSLRNVSNPELFPLIPSAPALDIPCESVS